MYKRILLLFVSILFLTSCNNDSDNISNATSINDWKFSIYVEKSDSISISYPVFENKNEDVNMLILSEVKSIFSDFKNDQRVNFHLDLSCKVVKTEKYLSIIYEGISYSKETAYPFRLLYSTNIDLLNMITVELSDICNISDNFISTFSDIANNQLKNTLIEESGFVFEKYFPKESLKKILIGNDNNKFVWFFNNDVIKINLVVIHALGDYLEISVPISFVER